MRKEKKHTEHGFTLIELMVAMAISLVVLTAIFMTFKSQQDSYVVQDQVTRMQQNLRGAMYVMTHDIQMAGYYTNFDSGTCTTDWDDLDDDDNTSTGTESVRPLIYGDENVTGAADIKDGTDVIVIIKACHEKNAAGNPVDSGTLDNNAQATGNTINLGDGSLNLDGQGDADLNTTGKKFGLLVKSDLTQADFFEISSIPGNINTVAALTNNYTTGDLIFRADVVIYKIDKNASGPRLVRKNLGSNNGFQVVAEDIDSLQVRYKLSGGTWVKANDPNFSPAAVRAVEVSLLARTGRTIRGYTDPNTYDLHSDLVLSAEDKKYRRKVLTSVIETRNIGL
jgi:prepilin-type N-terminal cleavage/methylation domain-containing protein